MEIKDRFTGKVLYSCGLNTIREVIERANLEGGKEDEW
jgi:hypothetical protein